MRASCCNGGSPTNVAPPSRRLSWRRPASTLRSEPCQAELKHPYSSWSPPRRNQLHLELLWSYYHKVSASLSLSKETKAGPPFVF